MLSDRRREEGKREGVRERERKMGDNVGERMGRKAECQREQKAAILSENRASDGKQGGGKTSFFFKEAFMRASI